MYFDQWMTMKLIMNEKETIYTVVKITKQHKIPICLTVHICFTLTREVFCSFLALFIFICLQLLPGALESMLHFLTENMFISTLMSGNDRPILLVHLHTNTTYSNTCTTVHWILQNTSEWLFSFFNLIFIHKSFCKNYSLLIVNCI